MKIIYCIAPITKLLTRFKEYNVIKELHNAYVIKRDDGSIDKIDKSRFTIYLEEMERLKLGRQKCIESLKKQFYCRKNNTCENQCPLCTGGETKNK